MAEALMDPIRTRLAVAFPRMMRSALDALDDDGIWWQPAPGTNPVAVLARHCAGNLRLFVGTYIGGIPYVRDRAAEFDASLRIPKVEVIADFDRAIAIVGSTLAGLDDTDLAGPSRDPERRFTTLHEDLLNATTHLALHAGQAVMLAKMRGAALPPELWREAHRSAGAWR